MPCLRTQRISIDSPATPSRRGSSFALALALTTASHTAHAVPTWFEGLVQTAPPYQSVVPIQNNLFERQHYTAVGARVGFQPWVWDPVALEWVYAVAPDETWTWQWYDTRSGAMIDTTRIRFVGGEGLCWSNGACGGVVELTGFKPLRCMSEKDRYRVETYHNGNFLGAGEFHPTRFTPKVSQTFLPESIEPKRIRSANGESAARNRSRRRASG